MTASKSNSTSFVSDMLAIAQAATEVETGCIYMVHAHHVELSALAKRLADRAADEKTRTILVNYWHESGADGERFMREYETLKGTEKRTPAQDTRFNIMQKQNNQINILLERTMKTYNGVAYLKQRGFAVSFEQDKKSKGTWVFYAKAKDEQDRVWFNAAQLMKIETCTAALDTQETALDVRTALKAFKPVAPNVNKGDAGERIAPSKIADAVTNLDTSLAAIAKDGGGYAVGTVAQEKLLLLWAQLDATLSDADKAKARDAFAKLGATPEKAKPVANIVEKVKTAIAGK